MTRLKRRQESRAHTAARRAEASVRRRQARAAQWAATMRLAVTHAALSQLSASSPRVLANTAAQECHATGSAPRPVPAGDAGTPREALPPAAARAGAEDLELLRLQRGALVAAALALAAVVMVLVATARWLTGLEIAFAPRHAVTSSSAPDTARVQPAPEISAPLSAAAEGAVPAAPPVALPNPGSAGLHLERGASSARAANAGAASTGPDLGASPSVPGAGEFDREAETANLAALPGVVRERPLRPDAQIIARTEPDLEDLQCRADDPPPAEAAWASIDEPEAFGRALAAAALRQTRDVVIYNDRYETLAYPMGDVPRLYGVCTDVVIRAYRALGIDLQARVHTAGIGAPDANIAHRRTFTLRRYFTARGASLPISEFAEDYRPGDIVTYARPQNSGSRDHIAIVTDRIGPSNRPMIVHNRGWGPQLEDALFVDTMTGHFRYTRSQDRLAQMLALRKQTRPGGAGKESAVQFLNRSKAVAARHGKVNTRSAPFSGGLTSGGGK